MEFVEFIEFVELIRVFQFLIFTLSPNLSSQIDIFRVISQR